VGVDARSEEGGGEAVRKGRKWEEGEGGRSI